MSLVDLDKYVRPFKESGYQVSVTKSFYHRMPRGYVWSVSVWNDSVYHHSTQPNLARVVFWLQRLYRKEFYRYLERIAHA